MSPEEIYAQIDHIPGWFSLEDVKGLSELKLPEKAMIVECGTYCGRSATALSLLFPTATIHTIDPVNEPDRVRGSFFIYHKRKGIELPWTDPIDLLFIDDSHQYDDIKANFDHFSPFVIPKGYIVFHDYYFESGDVEGVRRFVNELQSFTTTGGQYGLAIYQKPPPDA